LRNERADQGTVERAGLDAQRGTARQRDCTMLGVSARPPVTRATGVIVTGTKVPDVAPVVRGAAAADTGLSFPTRYSAFHRPRLFGWTPCSSRDRVDRRTFAQRQLHDAAFLRERMTPTE